MRNELDREPKTRGLHFIRYAYDCVVTARSVFYEMVRYRKPGLKVHVTKTIITRPTKIEYLGFIFIKRGGTISPGLRAAIHKRVEEVHEAHLFKGARTNMSNTCKFVKIC